MSEGFLTNAQLNKEQREIVDALHDLAAFTQDMNGMHVTEMNVLDSLEEGMLPVWHRLIEWMVFERSQSMCMHIL